MTGGAMMSTLLLLLALGAQPALASDELTGDAMRERLAACAACHGEDGRSHDEKYYPSIAGKAAGYLHQQMLNFRDGRRRHAIMQRLFAHLSDEYLAAMAQFYAAQQGIIAKPSSPASKELLEDGQRIVEVGDPVRDVPACTECHGAALGGVAPFIPGLTGLPADYLASQLGAWRTGARKARDPDCMARIASKLTEQELHAATAWIASLATSSEQRPADHLAAPLPMPCGSVP
jgi:cytochrome c553